MKIVLFWYDAGIGTSLSIGYKKCRRPENGRPRGGLMTKKLKETCPPSLGKALRWGHQVVNDFHCSGSSGSIPPISPGPFFFFSDPDFPEQVCPEYGHNQGETPDNRTTDQRIDLRNTGKSVTDTFHTVGQGIKKGKRHHPRRQ